MTGNERRGPEPAGGGPGVPRRRPWSFDDLAELHAGLLTDDDDARIRREISLEPEAHELLAALDATRGQLRTLPPEPMPVDIAARLDAVLAEESSRRAAAWNGPHRQVGPVPRRAPAVTASAPVVPLTAARGRRSRRLGWGIGVLAAAAVAAGVAVATVPGGRVEPGTPQAIEQAPPGRIGTGSAGLAPLAVSASNLTSAFTLVNNVADYGPLENPAKLAGCLSAVGIPNAGPPLGVRQVLLRDGPAAQGRPGVLVLLPGGKIGVFRLVVVGSTCSAANPLKLADTTIPGG